MGYPIVFQTKMLKLSDGNIMWLTRSGCNNDDEGRKPNKYTAKIVSEKDIIRNADTFKKDSKPYKECNAFDLKIGSNPATMYDYGEHILRMLKRAKDFSKFVLKYDLVCDYVEAVYISKPYMGRVSVREFDKMYYDLLHEHGNINYHPVRKILYSTDCNEETIVKAIFNHENAEITVRKGDKYYENN